MNPIEPTPQNNHDGRPKRRRLVGPSPGDTPAIDRYISTFNRSPVATSIPRQSAEYCPSNHDDDDSFTDRPFTQDPSLLPPPTSPSAFVSRVPAAADAAAQSDGAKDVSNAFVHAPPTFLPLKDIPPQELQIIKDALRDVYGIAEPRDFQLQAIHYLCFYDNPAMVLLRATADGKSLVPLTTSIIRTGVTLVLVPLHGLGSDQVDKATVLDHGVEAAATLVLQFQKIAQVELSVGDMLFRAYPAALA
jgi:hypothetical protein